MATKRAHYRVRGVGSTAVLQWSSSGEMGAGRDALEGKGPQRQPQKRLGRRLEKVAKAVGSGYCRQQMPLKLALGVGETVAGHRLGARGGGGYLPPFQCIPGGGGYDRLWFNYYAPNRVVSKGNSNVHPFLKCANFFA